MSRLDQPNEITPVGGTAPTNWLANYTTEDASLAGMAEMRVLQRVRILQGLSPKTLLTQFGGPGAIVLMPAAQLIAKPGSSFLFIPVFFFKEWIAWADRQDTSNKSAILERSLDPQSDLAIKSMTPDKRKEQYSVNGAFFTRTNVEHMNFAGLIVGHPELENQVAVVGFARGEWSTGKKFVNQILMRRMGGKTVPLWAQRWEFCGTTHKNTKNQEWEALEPRNPKDGQLFIDEQMAPAFQALHHELAEAHKNKAMVVDRSDEASTEAVEDLNEAQM